MMLKVGVCLWAAAIGCGDDTQVTPDAQLPDAPVIDAPMVDASPPDAAPLDFSCIGVPWPSTAPDPIGLGGTVVEPPAFSLVVGAAVEALRRSDDSSLGATSTSTTGRFSLAIPTGGNALDAYLHTSKTGYLDNYTFAPFPLFMNQQDVSVFLTRPATTIYGVTVDPAKALVGTIVFDCTGQRVGGATVTLTPPGGTIVYCDDPNLTETCDAGGIGIVNAEPSTQYDVHIVAHGHTYRTWTIKTYANSFSWALRFP